MNQTKVGRYLRTPSDAAMPNKDGRYLYLQDIEGACTDAGHEHWIAATEYHFESDGRFVFTHRGDSAAKIQMFCMFGQPIGYMVFHSSENGILRKIAMQNVRIKSVYTFVGADGTTCETVTLSAGTTLLS